MQRFIGCHVSTAGGLENGLKNANLLGINTMQIHAVPPQRWNSNKAAPNIENKYLELLPDSGVQRVFCHAIYLINLVSADPKNFKLSKLSLQNSMDLLARLGGEGLIFHVGSLKELDEETGFKQAAEAIDEIMEEAPGEGKLLLEVSAGGGNIVGDKIEELRKIFDLLKNPARVGFALDTQHMWASGYNWRESLEEVVQEIEKHFGIERVGAIHLNDSLTEFASRKDRHANLGEGLIGESAMKAVLNHTKLKSIPFILETPAMKDIAQAKIEAQKLKNWAIQ
jgi:deoxyribonuclease-4